MRITTLKRINKWTTELRKCTKNMQKKFTCNECNGNKNHCFKFHVLCNELPKITEHTFA